MDTTRFIVEHPELIARILARSTGFLGEILLADRLTELGYLVRPAAPGAKMSDLLAVSPNGVEFSIEVKSGASKRPTWYCKRPDPARSAFWVFICMPRELNEFPDLKVVEYLVLTANEARLIWDSNPYNKKPDLDRRRPIFAATSSPILRVTLGGSCRINPMKLKLTDALVYVMELAEKQFLVRDTELLDIFIMIGVRTKMRTIQIDVTDPLTAKTKTRRQTLGRIPEVGTREARKLAEEVHEADDGHDRRCCSK